MELLNLSLAILNRSSFNRVKPDMLASILGPHIFTSQHATILQHTPQQAYSFGWGVALVNDIKRCSKMFYVLLGGYRREILGFEDWEYERAPNSCAPSTYNMFVLRKASSSGSVSRGQVNQWLGSTASLHGGGIGGAASDPEDEQNPHFVNCKQRLHQSVPQLRVMTDNATFSSPRNTGYGMARSVSTTLSESFRAAAAQEAKAWNLNPSGSVSKGPAALRHLRGAHHDNRTTQRLPTVEQRQQELFDVRFRSRQPEEGGGDTDELSSAFRRHNLYRKDGDPDECSSEQYRGIRTDDPARMREQKRQAIEQMIRECRGAGLDFVCRENE